ncbi:hypothetical protein [Kibdelosporangium aridum]|uniref:hypothetical protein n=1 Tax=Kibdelosporangium aridum TaxID=2030 RepID=UPI00052582A2
MNWIKTPAYYKYYGKTFRIDTDADDELTGHVLNLRTGAFDRADDQVDRVMFSRSGDVYSLSEAEFVNDTEVERATYLTGDGPIFALYDTIKAIRAHAAAEGRKLTPHETALIVGLRKKTFKMWEEEFARRDNGEPAENVVAAEDEESSA